MKVALCVAITSLAFLWGSIVEASPLPYSLSGTDDLSVVVTTLHSAWPPAPTIDGVYMLNSGWWNPAQDESIMFTFNSGSLTVNKIQIFSGSTLTNHTVEHCNLFYTTDPNPTFSSTFLPLTNLAFINDVDGIITGNDVYMLEAVNELLISFDAVNATAIRILDHSDGTGGDDERFSGRSLFNEVTIDGGASIPAVPEPLSIVLLLSSLAVLKRRRK